MKGHINLRRWCLHDKHVDIICQYLAQNCCIQSIDLSENWGLTPDGLRRILVVLEKLQGDLGSLKSIQMDSLQEEARTVCERSPRVIANAASPMVCLRCGDRSSATTHLFKLGQGENETFGKCADKICGGYYHQSCGLQYCNRKGTEHVHCGLCNTDLGAASSVMRDLCSDAALRQTILYRAEVAQKIEDSLSFMSNGRVFEFNSKVATDIAAAVEDELCRAELEKLQRQISQDAQNRPIATEAGDSMAIDVVCAPALLQQLMKQTNLQQHCKQEVLKSCLRRPLSRHPFNLSEDCISIIGGGAWLCKVSFADALELLSNRERLAANLKSFSHEENSHEARLLHKALFPYGCDKHGCDMSTTKRLKRLPSTCPEIDDEVQKVMEFVACTEDIARKAITRCRSHYQGDVSQRAIELLCNFDLDSDHDDSEDDDDSNLSEDGDAETMDMEEDRDDDQAENSPTFATSRSKRVWTWADFESMRVVPRGMECGEHDEHDPLQCPVTSQVFSLRTREQQLSFLNSQKQFRETQSKSELRKACEGLPPPALSSGGTKEEMARRLLRWSIGRSLESDYKAEEEQNQKWLEQYRGDISSDYEDEDEDDLDDEDYDSGHLGASTGPKPAAKAGQSAASAAKSPRNRRSAAAAAASVTSHNSGRARGSEQFARSEGTFMFKDNGATLELRYILVKGCYWLSLQDVILFVNPLERSSVGRRLENLKKANPDLEVQSHKSRQCIRAGWIREVVVTLRKMDRKANHRSRMGAGEEDFQDCLAYEWLLTKERELRQSCPVSIPPSCFAVVFDDSSTTVCTAEASPNADSSAVDNSVKNHDDLLQEIRSFLASSTADPNAMLEEELFELKHSLDEKLNMLVPPDEFGIHWITPASIDGKDNDLTRYFDASLEGAVMPVLKEKFNITKLKELQKEVIAAVAKGHSVVFHGPPAHGKSLFFLLPSMLNEIQTSDKVNVIVTPFNSLRDDQQAELERLGVPFYVLTSVWGTVDPTEEICKHETVLQQLVEVRKR